MHIHRRTFLGAAFAFGLSVASMQPARADDVVVGYAVPELGSSFWISATYGVEDEAKLKGVKLVKVAAGSDANASQQISQIQDLVQRKVSALIVGATDGNAVKAVVEQAIAAGIPVIGLSSPPNTDKLLATVSADHYDMGRLQAQCLAKAIGGSGDVAMLGGASGQAWADLRVKGFRETLAKDFPNVKVVAENRNSYTRNDAIRMTEDWLQRFPDLKGVYSAYDDLGAGVVTVLKTADKLAAVKVSTSNLSPTASDMIKNGELACSSIQPIVAQGRKALDIAVDAAGGKPPADKQVALAALLVDGSNLASIDLSSVSAPADYKP